MRARWARDNGSRISRFRRTAQPGAALRRTVSIWMSSPIRRLCRRYLSIGLACGKPGRLSHDWPTPNGTLATSSTACMWRPATLPHARAVVSLQGIQPDGFATRAFPTPRAGDWRGGRVNLPNGTPQSIRISSLRQSSNATLSALVSPIFPLEHLDVAAQGAVGKQEPIAGAQVPDERGCGTPARRHDYQHVRYHCPALSAGEVLIDSERVSLPRHSVSDRGTRARLSWLTHIE